MFVLYSTLYSIQCTLYIVHCTLYSFPALCKESRKELLEMRAHVLLAWVTCLQVLQLSSVLNGTTWSVLVYIGHIIEPIVHCGV